MTSCCSCDCNIITRKRHSSRRQKRCLHIYFVILLLLLDFTRVVSVTERTTDEDNKKKQRSNRRNSSNRKTGQQRTKRPFENQQQGRWGSNSNSRFGTTDESNISAFELYSRFVQNGTKALSVIFPTRQPRHVIEGTLNLAKSVATGFAMGLLSILAMPITGFRQGGWAGMVAGGLAGTLYGTIFAMIGLANGAYQMARGAIETPKAIIAAQNGLVWDKDTEKWKVYYLEDELEELTAYANYKDSGRVVRDRTYYDLLQVSTSAVPKEIKKAYYKKARELHPDKNPNDQLAADKFRKLHTAYLTLIDDEKRAAYDKWGTKRTPEMNEPNIPEFDPFVFYAILFNSQAVEPYIGDLTVASFTNQLLLLIKAGGGQSAEDYVKLLWGGTDHNVRKRQLEIAIHLKGKVNNYVTGIETKNDFRILCRNEALSIATSPFGTQYLYAIGSALVLEASQFLGFQRSLLGWFTGIGFLMKRNVRKFRSMMTIVRETIEVLKILPIIDKDTTRTDHEKLDEVLPELLDIAWAYNYQDISRTINGACTRLFTDASANSRYKRLERAEAIQMMGEEFLLIANSEKNKEQENEHRQNLVSRCYVAFQISQMKATGMETPGDSETMIKNHKKTRVKAR